MHSNNSFARRARRCLVLAAMTASVALAACSDESQTELPAQTPAPVAEEKPLHQIEWLRLTDGVSPDRWLASREAGRSLDQMDPAVADMRRVLDIAGMRFRDQTRMIANRAVQLEAMLKEMNIDERAPRIIVSLSQVPGQTRYVESFGALTQQYYNLRVEGASRSQALDRLRQQNAMTP